MLTMVDVFRSTGGETIEIGMEDAVYKLEGLKCGTVYHFFCTVRNVIGE